MNIKTLNRFGVFKTQECWERDEFSRCVGWDTEYVQLGRGRYRARVDYCVDSRLRITRQRSNLATSITGVPPRGCVAFLLPRVERHPVKVNGSVLDPNEMIVMRQDSDCTIRTPVNFEMMTVCLDASNFEQAFEKHTRSQMKDCIGAATELRLPPEIWLHLANLGRDIILSGKRRRAGRTDNFIAEAEDAFIRALILGLVQDRPSKPGNRARANHMKYFKRARDAIEGNLARPLSLAQLSRLCGVSPRTLNYAFRNILDVTPLHYIKAHRLYAAERLLSAADPYGDKVKRIARACGFTHLGYFSRDYEAMFGELPSVTLRSWRRTH